MALGVTAVMGAMFPTAVQAGRGSAVGAGLVGFGAGALVGTALTPREVYVVPPPPPAYYGPGYMPHYGPGYVPQPWSPGWYSYCRGLYGPAFNPNTGYFRAANGGWHLCQ